MRTTSLACALACGFALEARAEPEADALRACAAREPAAERLACYDRLAGRDVPDPEDGFGFPPTVLELQPDAISGTIIEAEDRKRGGVIVRLSNGQLWELSGIDHVSLPNGELPVTIRRAALGSFLMTIRGNAVRARRLR